MEKENIIKNLIGKDGIKTDLKVTPVITDDVYYKLGAVLILVAVLSFAMFFTIKSIAK